MLLSFCLTRLVHYQFNVLHRDLAKNQGETFSVEKDIVKAEEELGARFCVIIMFLHLKYYSADDFISQQFFFFLVRPFCLF